KTNVGIESRLKDKVIQFKFTDFAKYLGVNFGGGPISLIGENFYGKPKNSSRDDNSDLYLIRCLINRGMDW
ncbi:hypothetical protein RYX36_035976, partial [Vicia faba]